MCFVRSFAVFFLASSTFLVYYCPFSSYFLKLPVLAAAPDSVSYIFYYLLSIFIRPFSFYLYNVYPLSIVFSIYLIFLIFIAVLFHVVLIFVFKYTISSFYLPPYTFLFTLPYLSSLQLQTVYICCLTSLPTMSVLL